MRDPAALDPPQVEPPPVALAELALTHLRSYRRRLSSEEDAVSYWRRVLQARIDVLEAERTYQRPLRLEELVRALGDTGAGKARRALLTVQAAEPLPQLPVLQEIWETEVDPQDVSAVALALERLRAAETQISDYRTALHTRIDDATAELIGRYRADPLLALTALPRPRRHRPSRPAPRMGAP